MEAENFLKMKTFLTTTSKAYPHEKLNTSNGVIRIRELFLATAEEITATLGKQGFKDFKRITTRKGGEQIQANPHCDF